MPNKTKTMTAILIDPFKKEISEVQIGKSLEEIYTHIEAETFECLFINKERDALYIDEEGLFKLNKSFFGYKGVETPITGKALVLGHTRSGDSTTPSISIDEVRANVQFLS